MLLLGILQAPQHVGDDRVDLRMVVDPELPHPVVELGAAHEQLPGCR
jgi:hypothetical protein